MATRERARDAAEGFHALLSGAAAPMLVVDDQRRVIGANEAAFRLLGLDAAGMAECTIEALTPEALRPMVASLWETFIADGTMAGDYRFQRPDGDEIVVWFNAIANVGTGAHLTILTPREEDEQPAGRRACGDLSRRERQVLRLVAYGKSGAQIAEALGIAPETVRVHVRNAMQKLGAKTRAQAIGIAMTSDEI